MFILSHKGLVHFLRFYQFLVQNKKLFKITIPSTHFKWSQRLSVRQGGVICPSCIWMIFDHVTFIVILSSKQFPTQRALKRPFTSVYPLVSFHVGRVPEHFVTVWTLVTLYIQAFQQSRLVS